MTGSFSKFGFYASERNGLLFSHSFIHYRTSCHVVNCDHKPWTQPGFSPPTLNKLERSKTSRSLELGHSETADRALERYFAKSTTGNIFILHKPMMLTLITLSVRGTDSSTSSMNIPPSPRWSCLSSSRSKPFLSLTLRAGRNRYLSPSTTSILGLFNSAWRQWQPLFYFIKIYL